MFRMWNRCSSYLCRSVLGLRTRGALPQVAGARVVVPARAIRLRPARRTQDHAQESPKNPPKHRDTLHPVKKKVNVDPSLAEMRAARKPRTRDSSQTALVQAQSAREVLEIFEIRRSSLSAVNLCTALHRIAKHGEKTLFLRGATNATKHLDKRVALLLHDVQQSITQLNGQGVSNALWAIARLVRGVPPEHIVPIDSLVRSLCASLVQRANQLCTSMEPTGLANSLWAIGVLHSAGISAKPSVIPLVEECTRRIHAFEPHGMTIVSWALGTIKLPHPPPQQLAFLRASKARFLEDPHAFSLQSLSNITWSYAELDFLDVDLFAVMMEEFRTRELDHSGQALSTLVWAVGRAGSVDEDALLELLLRHRSAFSDYPPQSLFMLTWGLGRLYQGRTPPAAVTQIAREVAVAATYAPQRLLTPQIVSILCWGMASMEVCDMKFYNAMQRSAMKNMGAYSGKALSILAWALATCCAARDCETTMRAIARQTASVTASLSAQSLSNLAWAFATLDVRGDEVERCLDTIGEAVGDKLQDAAPQVFSNTAWAFATMGKSVPSLYNRMVQEAAPRISDFSLQNMIMFTWGVSAAEDVPRSALRQWMDRVSQRVLEEQPTLDAKAISMLLWSCANRDFFDSSLTSFLVRAAKQRNETSIFEPQHLTTVCWSLGTLSYVDDGWMNAAANRAIQSLSMFNPQDCAMFAWALARFYRPDRHIIDETIEHALAIQDKFSLGEMASFLWSLCVLNEHQRDDLRPLWLRLQHAYDLPSDSLRQLYQIQLSFRLDNVLGEPFPELDRKLDFLCSRAWLGSRFSRSSMMHQEVSDALHRIGLDHVNEFDAEYSIDIYVEHHGRRLALEVDGPVHFAVNDAHRPTGATLIKRRHLDALGYDVASLHYLDWKRARSDEEREALLRRTVPRWYFGEP